MKNLVYSKLIAVSHNADNQFLEIVWDSDSDQFNKGEFLNELVSIADTIRDLKVNSLLIDLSPLDYYFPAELRTFSIKDLSVIFKDISINKLAFILPENIFSRILLEANFISILEEALLINYFTNKEEAEKWLKIC